MQISPALGQIDINKVVTCLRKLYNGLTEEKYSKLGRLILESE